MRKRLTLKRTWKLCLEMWKWVAEQMMMGDECNVITLKHIWMEKNCPDESIQSDCFFCEYNNRNNKSRDGGCGMCPGKLVIKNFCCGDKRYNYSQESIKFYEKLVWVNNLREKRNAKSTI